MLRNAFSMRKVSSQTGGQGRCTGIMSRSSVEAAVVIVGKHGNGAMVHTLMEEGQKGDLGVVYHVIWYGLTIAFR